MIFLRIEILHLVVIADGIFEKIYGARQAGIHKVIMPAENAKDVPDDITGIEVVPVASVSEAFTHVFEGDMDFRRPNEE